jgi:zinc protease
MKIRFLIIMTILVALSSKRVCASEAESFTVNGLKVIFKQNTATDIVAAGVYFRGGSTVLTRQQAGIEDLALTVAAKATVHFPKEKLNSALESMNTQIDASATLDYSSLNLMCVKQHFGKSWEIFVDMLLSPLFDTQDVELERQKMLSRIKQSRDNPDQYLNDLIIHSFYRNHPYEVDANGNENTVSAFTAADLKNHLKNRLVTSHMLLVVVGNTTRTELEKMVQQAFGAIPQGKYEAVIPPAIRHQEPSIKIVQRELPTNYIMGYFPTPAFASEESYPMFIAGSVLRDNLFEEVRTKRGLSYAPGGGTGGLFSNFGFVYVTAVNPDTTIKVIIAELRRLIDEQISKKKLGDKLNVFITSYYLRNEANQSQAMTLARYELAGVGYQEADKFVQNVKRVTPDEIQKVCKKYIGNLQFVLIGNPASLEVKNFMF